MESDEIVRKTEKAMEGESEVLFAYVHGSVLDGEKARDVDVAVYVDPPVYSRLRREGDLSMEFAIPLEMRLEKALGRKADVQVLNRAPLGFRYRVISTGRVFLRRDERARDEFECLSRVEYFDFQPRRKEYLREALA